VSVLLFRALCAIRITVESELDKIKHLGQANGLRVCKNCFTFSVQEPQKEGLTTTTNCCSLVLWVLQIFCKNPIVSVSAGGWAVWVVAGFWQAAIRAAIKMDKNQRIIVVL